MLHLSPFFSGSPCFGGRIILATVSGLLFTVFSASDGAAQGTRPGSHQVASPFGIVDKGAWIPPDIMVGNKTYYVERCPGGVQFVDQKTCVVAYTYMTLFSLISWQGQPMSVDRYIRMPGEEQKAYMMYLYQIFSAQFYRDQSHDQYKEAKIFYSMLAMYEGSLEMQAMGYHTLTPSQYNPRAVYDLTKALRDWYGVSPSPIKH